MVEGTLLRTLDCLIPPVEPDWARENHTLSMGEIILMIELQIAPRSATSGSRYTMTIYSTEAILSDFMEPGGCVKLGCRSIDDENRLNTLSIKPQKLHATDCLSTFVCFPIHSDEKYSSFESVSLE